MGFSVSSIISQDPLLASLQSATPNRFHSSIHFLKPISKERPMQRTILSHNPEKTMTSVLKTPQILPCFPKFCPPSPCFSSEGVWVQDAMLRSFLICLVGRRLWMLERGRVLVRNETSQLPPKPAFDPARFTSNGNLKLLEDLVLAAPEGVLVNADSEFDLNNIVSAARIAGKNVNVLRRINPDVDPQGPYIPELCSARPILGLEVVKAHPNGLKPLVNDCHLGWTNTKLGTTGPSLYTSESVTEGHPDKLCDKISDKVLDAYLEQDPDSRVTCYTWTKNDEVGVVGKITTRANVDCKTIVRDACREVGYVCDHVGLDADLCKVLLDIDQQSPDIAQGGPMRPEDIGASDQVILVFGYATDETRELMPLAQLVANKATASMDCFRKKGTYLWLGPASKVRVTCEYSDVNGAMVPVRVHTVDIITQHQVTKDEINAAEFIERAIKSVIPEMYLDEKTNFNLILSNQFK